MFLLCFGICLLSLLVLIAFSLEEKGNFPNSCGFFGVVQSFPFLII